MPVKENRKVTVKVKSLEELQGLEENVMHAVLEDKGKIREFSRHVNLLPSGKSRVGGFVESTAQVSSTAYVGPKAVVAGNAQIKDNSRIDCTAIVSGDVVVSGEASVFGNARVSGYVQISGYAMIFGNAKILDSEISDNALVFGYAVVQLSRITDSCICDNAKVYDSDVHDTEAKGDAYIWKSLVGFEERLKGQIRQNPPNQK